MKGNEERLVQIFKPILAQCSISITHGNVRKPVVFLYFQGL